MPAPEIFDSEKETRKVKCQLTNPSGVIRFIPRSLKLFKVKVKYYWKGMKIWERDKFDNLEFPINVTPCGFDTGSDWLCQIQGFTCC